MPTAKRDRLMTLSSEEVSTAVSVTYSAAGLCAYPLLWLPRPSSPCGTVAPVPPWLLEDIRHTLHTDHTRAQR